MIACHSLMWCNIMYTVLQSKRVDFYHYVVFVVFLGVYMYSMAIKLDKQNLIIVSLTFKEAV